MNPKNPESQIARFKSEHLLQQAIASLLTRVPGISDVQILQGAQEYGKDIVFRSTGPLGESIYCACVVKNKRLTGKVGTTGSMRAVYDQIEQALDTPFLDGSGEERRVHHVYVMSPGEISQPALNSIAGKLAARSGQVIYRCGTALYEMFMRYWPDFFAEEGAVLASYAARLEEAGRSSAALSILALEHGFGPVPETAPQVYVEPSFRREIHRYELQWPVAWLFEWEELNSSWTKVRVGRARSSLEETIKFLEHCASWPIIGWNHDEHLARAKELVSACNEGLRDALLSAFRTRTGQQRATYEKIHESSQIQLELSSIKAINSLLQHLDAELTPIRRFTEETLENIVQWLSTYSPNDNPLLDPTFRKQCSIDDCLSAYVGPFLRSRARRAFQLGSNLHRRYPGSLVIEGGPGSGKTSFCRWSALTDASTLVGCTGDVLPVYVPLHELSGTSGGTFQELFLSRIGRSVLIPEHAASQSDLRRRLYLDGLDEVTEAGKRAALMSIAKSGSESIAEYQVIVTVRDYIRERSLNWVSRVTLSGLEPEELLKLAEMWLDGDEAAAQAFTKQVSSSTALDAVARVPLLATVMILVFKRTGRVPENRARLYSVFVNLLCGGWDLAKGIVRTSRFGVTYKLRVLNSVGHQLHLKRKKEFDAEWFAHAVVRVVPRQSSEERSILLSELLADGIITRTGSNYEFGHLSFQEFFAARDLLGDPSAAGRQKALRAFIGGDQWWREVLIFYIGLSESPEAVVRWLVVAADSADSTAREHLRVLLDAVRDEFPDFDPDSVFSRPPLGGRSRPKG